MTSPTIVALGRARGAVVVGMVGFTAASWIYVGFLATQMGDMSAVLAMPMTAAWSPAQTALMVTMWAVMMAAMMLPSAVPMVLAYDQMDRGPAGTRGGSTVLFVAGYIVVWVAFAVAATGLQGPFTTWRSWTAWGQRGEAGWRACCWSGPGSSSSLRSRSEAWAPVARPWGS